MWYRGWRIKLLPEDPLYKDLYPTTTLGRSRAVRMGPETYRLGFNGATLTILSEGSPALDLVCRRIEGVGGNGFHGRLIRKNHASAPCVLPQERKSG